MKMHMSYETVKNCLSIGHVSSFMKAGEQEFNEDTANLYLGLMLEEMGEALDAEGYAKFAGVLFGMATALKTRSAERDIPRNTIGAFDAGLDVLWVTIGFMLAKGFPIADGWNEVARSNRSKLVDGRLLKDKNGKVMKPEGYSPPDLVRLLSVPGTAEQTEPTPNAGPAVWDLVLDDMRQRDKTGTARYGTPLQPHNGRDALTDAYQEALDLSVYLRQALFERDGK